MNTIEFFSCSLDTGPEKRAYIPGKVFRDQPDQRWAIKTKMVVDMELQEAKDAVLHLMKEKDKIESDLRALKEVLDSVCITLGFTP